nr:PREDICTED: zinc finger protein 512B isoform X1 [Latimeria chalumnae]|eukprot:XP_006011895.1 PREDICTED: zinc finger protein 512B isoform X1 [Latimeria chalumnae]
MHARTYARMYARTHRHVHAPSHTRAWVCARMHVRMHAHARTHSSFPAAFLHFLTRCFQPSEESDAKPDDEEVEDFERTPSGRIRRRSAQVAVFHLQEIAEDELAKDWSKRRMKDDLVPDTKRLNYTRPGLPKFNARQLENWKNEVKGKGHISCPNNHCEAIYSSVSGLKAHLANCDKGSHSVGKYRCLLCQKEFSSESGVKYHIIKAHSENWFRASSETSPRNKKPGQSTLLKDKKKSTMGKRRGRKPKERPPESCPPKERRENAETKTNREKSTQTPQESSSNNNNDNERKEKVNKLPGNRKGVTSKTTRK